MLVFAVTEVLSAGLSPTNEVSCPRGLTSLETWEVVRPDTLASEPERIPYANGCIRYRHYGRFLEGLINKAKEMPEGAERKQLVHLIAIQMRKNFITWNKDSVEIQKLIADLEEYTGGVISLSEADLEIAELQPSAAQRHRAAMVQQRRRPARRK